jgi:hypothetical protein
VRSLSLQPDDLLTIPRMALSIDSMRFVSSAHAVPATGYISLLLDILFGSFLPSLWSSSNHSLLGSRSRHCYAIKWNLDTKANGRFRQTN